MTSEQEARHDMKPSKVVHCRAVAKLTKETDLVEVMRMFGNIKALKLMPKISQALVEFEQIESAIACITYCTNQPIILHGRQMYSNYSKSKEISRKFATKTETTSPTNILLVTVLNVIHPVNVNTLRTICQQQGIEIQRAVIFHKNGLQALIEFKMVDEAAQILRALNGCDIYPGCCTLKVEYSYCKQLNVWENSDESYCANTIQCRPNNVNNSKYSDWDGNPIHSSSNGHISEWSNCLGTSAIGGEGCVAMVYNINNEKVNCEHLFNLFCLYGNIVKIKILTGKEGIAMVQFGNHICTKMAIQHLNHLNIQGKQLHISLSKHEHITDPTSGPPPLFDGTPAFQNYLKDRNNRFSPGGKNDPYSRVNPPSKVLHYFNAPPGTTEERINELLQSYNVQAPLKQMSITRQGATSKASSGLLEFSSIAIAAEVMMVVNHVTLYRTPVEEGDEKTGSPYTFKLEFSLSTSINK